jgi:hypothetical protein
MMSFLEPGANYNDTHIKAEDAASDKETGRARLCSHME